MKNMRKIKVSYLTLVRGEKKSDRTPEIQLKAEQLEAVESGLRRRGQLYDYMLGSLRDYARIVAPQLTIDEAADLLIDFPLFVSELQVNWNGSGLVRELPFLSRQEAYSQ